jgi:hypothetical protein
MNAPAHLYGAVMYGALTCGKKADFFLQSQNTPACGLF